jgi:hypothetical protein
MATAKTLVGRARRLRAQYTDTPSQNLLAEIYDLIGEMEESDAKTVKAELRKIRALAEKESAKAAAQIEAKGGVRPPRRRRTRNSAPDCASNVSRLKASLMPPEN